MVTGSRAEYGLLFPVMRAIQRRRDLELQLIVTGMHLLRRFGATIAEIRRDGFTIDARVAMQRECDGELVLADGLARGVAGIARHLHRRRSDIVVVLGDRVEALAGALAATTTDRILAHIHGGDVAPGHLDDAFRHAITKLAHVHFAASSDAARRIIRLGENPKQVHVVGAPGLDDLLTVPRPARGWLAERFGFPRDAGVAIVLHHPIGRPARVEQRVMANLLSAVQLRGLSGLIIYPNNDSGHSGIIEAIQQHMARHGRPKWVCVRSMRRFEFLQCLKAAGVLVGNSSAGIIEANPAGTPAVNIGARQAGRLRSGSAIVDCGESRAAIATALGQALKMRALRRRSRCYGLGHAGSRIARILARTTLSDNLRRKRICY